MTMKDSNGVEIRTGDIVEIKDAYFKGDNGFYFVRYSPGDPDYIGKNYGLHKVGKRGKVSTAKNSVAFWPLVPIVSNRLEKIEAITYNSEHATITVRNDICRNGVAREFSQEIFIAKHYLKNHSENYGEENHITNHSRKVVEHYEEVINRIELSEKERKK